MAFRHLVDPPRPCTGGVLFTLDTHDVQRTVVVRDEALALLAPGAASGRDKVHAVMTQMSDLCRLAIGKAGTSNLPELIVIGMDDVTPRARAG